MKNLKQKLLISLILGLGLFIGCSFAETINVQGRNPWGVLRLNKIILQKTNAINLTGILLDGQDYVIRVGSVNQSGVTIIGSGSKVHTNQICDANGNNCKQVSALGNGGSGGGNGSGIIAFGTGGEICYLNEDGENLTCDNGVLQVLSGTIAELVAMFRATIDNNNNNIEYSIPVTVSATGSNTGYYCSSTDGETLKCNNSISGLGGGSGITALGTGGEICYLYTGDDGSRNLMCDNSVLQVLSGTIAQLVAFFRHTPAQGQGTGTVVPVIVSNTGANTGYYCSSTDGDTLKCNNPVSGGGDTILSGELGKRCRYGAIVNGNRISWNGTRQPTDTIQTGIICTTNDPSLWNNTNETIYTKNLKPVAIRTTTSSGYTLNVNGSGRIATKFNIGDNLWFLNSQQRRVYTPGGCSSTYTTGPIIRYSGTLAFGDNDGTQCDNGYTEFGDDGRVGIGGPTEPGTKLSVYGHTKIYSTLSANNRYIDIYNDGFQSNVISEWSDMKIGLTGVQDIIGIPVPSSYIYIKKDNIGINRVPNPSTRHQTLNPDGYYSPTLQVSGSIQISSEYPISNSQQASNKMVCNQQIEGTIAYYNGNFYGCAKTSTNEYFWRLLNTSPVNGDDLPALPVPPTGSAS